MIYTLFQVIPDSAVDSVQGFPPWAFWLLVIIIVILFTFILIRDRGVREKIKKIFSWIAKKIRMARIKSKINQKKQKKQNLVIRLGKEVWEKKRDIPGTENEISEIQKLIVDEKKLEEEIQKIAEEIEQNNLTLDQLIKDKEQKVSAIMEKKKPLDIEFKAFKKERDILEADVKEKDRLRIKTAKNITQQMQEITRIENDEYLSKIEKGLRRKELEKRITDLRKEEVNISSALTISREKLADFKQKNDQFSQKFSGHQNELDQLDTDYNQRQQKIEDVIDALVKNKNALKIKSVGLGKQLSLEFEKLGEIINQKRIDSSDLLGIYTQLDNISKSIKDLEGRLK